MPNNRDFESRMQGMNRAYEIAKNDGIDALRSELNARGVLGLEFNIPIKETKAIWEEMSQNIYANMLTCIMYSLQEDFGFEAEMIKRLKETYDKHIKEATDLDYLGSNYVRIYDYAFELNEKYGLGIDLKRLMRTQNFYNSGLETYHMASVPRLIERFRAEGMEEAARFLEERIKDEFD